MLSLPNEPLMVPEVPVMVQTNALFTVVDSASVLLPEDGRFRCPTPWRWR
jgi:hypothetical protein